MNYYELVVVLSSKLEDDERAAAMEKVKGYVTRFGGTIINVDEWGRRKLAYEIQHMKEGYYYFVHFESGPETPGQLESNMRIMEPVIRYLCVKMPPQEVTALKKRLENQDQNQEVPEEPQTGTEVSEEPAAEEPAAEEPAEESTEASSEEKE